MIAGAIIALVLMALIAWPVVLERRRLVMDADARKGMPGRLARLSKGQTHYQWAGTVRGPVAVCVHGLTTPSFVWGALVPGLERLGYRVLIYDLYGRGYSDRPRGAQTPEVFVRQLEELLVDQGIEDEITLIGYSMGGVISTVFAANHPTRTRQLVLLAPAGVEVVVDKLTRFIARTPFLGRWLMGLVFAASHRAGISKEESSYASQVPEVFELQRKELAYQGYVRSVHASMRGLIGRSFEKEHRDLHARGVPVLAIWGRKDEVIPITSLGTMSIWNRSASQEVVEEGGHGLPYTHSQEVLDALGETLRDGLT